MKFAMFRHTLGVPSEQFIEDQRDGFGGIPIVGMRRDSRTESAAQQLIATSGLPILGGAQDTLFRGTRRSWGLEAEFARIKPDVVIAHFLFDAWRVLPTCRRLNIPVVALAHGSELTLRPDLARKAFRSLRELTEQWQKFTTEVAAFGAVSNYLAEILIDRGVDASRVIQTYIGTHARPPSISRRASPSAPILFVGRLENSKAADIAIAAHSEWKLAGVNRALLIIGDGSQFASLREKTLDLQGSGDIEFLGMRSHHEVLSRMRSAFALVSPSRTLSSGISEGLGQVSIEAQAVGTPAIVAATGGLPETVDDHVSGFIVPPESPESIALKVIELHQDPGLWEEMSISAVRHVRRRFEPKHNARVFSDKIDALLEGNKTW